MIKQSMQPIISINENLELKYENNDFLDLIDESKGCTATLCQQFKFRIGCSTCHLSDINLKYYFEHKLKDLKQQMIDYKSDFKKPCFHCSSSFHGSSYEDGHFNLQKMFQVDNECVICMTHFTIERSFHHNCNICNASFKNCQLLAHHNLTKHNSGNPHQCAACHQSLPHRAALRYHIRKHKLPDKCPYCNKRFAEKSSLKSHMISHTGGKAFSCKYCSKQYKQKINLDYHYLYQHNDVKQYKCDLCDKTFALQNLLYQHKMVHTENRCKYCFKQYESKRSLDIHLYEHTGVKKFKCDECNTTFAKGHMLNKHKYIHMEEKSFQCNYCPKKYKRKVSLDLHLYEHIGDKLFKCDLCDKAFAKRHRLNDHKNIHVEGSIQCKFCSKSYKTPKYLRRHISRVHNKEYKCDLCNKYFDKYGLNKHKRVHQ